MTGPLLEGKLHAPKPRSTMVERPRLSERLEGVTAAKLTLVSAPAGFGKTTLLADRQAALGDGRSAWLSLDAGDDDPNAFWAHVIAALQTAVPGIGVAALPLVEAPPEPPHAGITALLNDLGALSTDLELVLDDYHVIGTAEIHDSMAYFLEHLPPRAHVVITTRADPALPLARMRARGELVEIRAADLRFRPDETDAYLNGAMGLELSHSELAVLVQRTEGWIAALQLAGLSVQGRDDASAFIEAFAGDDRYIIDYLVEEVLERQSDATRRFLLQTAILTRMSGPLCDAVTGEDDGRATLEALERGNLFVVPLDDRREWYRYHHLFADVLRSHLKDEQPERIAELHRRASAWHEAHGDRTEAIEHAIAGEDYIRAAELVELAMPAMQQRRQEGLLRRMLEALPSEVFRDRPVLTVGYAGVLLSTGHVDGVEELLVSAERMVGPQSRPGPRPKTFVVVDEAELPRLPGAIAMYRTALAQVHGDVAGSIEHAQRALQLIEEGDHLRRGGVAALLGLAHWTEGDLEQAYRWYSEGMASLEQGGYRADVVGGAVTLADIRLAQGRLGEAMRHYQRGLELATRGGSPALRGAADMHVGLAAVAYERNDLEMARQHLREAGGLGEENGLPKNPWRSRVVAARLRHADGDFQAALDLLDEAERMYAGDFSPNVRPVASVRARMWITEGRLSDARAWASASGVSATGELTYLSEFEHATLARLLVAEGRRGHDERRIVEAMELTTRLVEAAETGGRWGSAIDVLVVSAVARQAGGDAAGALANLARAMELAEPEGYVRAFVDEGLAMTSLLTHAAKVGGTTPYLARLLAAGAVEGDRRAGAQALVEPLSERELEVLRLLTTDLSGPDMARELVVSLNTLRTHTKNIYAKLGVSSRRAAVRRASELDLLHRSGVRPPRT